jgi:hypothetical protein
LPDLGGGGVAKRPDVKLPSRPGDGDRPVAKLPGKPGGARPSPGDVGDFLGLDKPVTLPAEIGKRPGVGDRPVTLPAEIGKRPGGGDRPVTLPAEIGKRPGGGDRPGGEERPGIKRPGRPGGDINIGEINVGNKVINHRPAWVNIDNDRITGIHNRWGNQVGGLHNWHDHHPGRVGYWHGWADGVRTHWRYDYRHCFGPNWWNDHHHGFAGWHYCYHFNRHPWGYWWTFPTFVACTRWFTWPAPETVWAQPIYYDYGQGGNVTYQDNSVYINNQPVASADEFAQSAAALATVPPPADETQAATAEWLPLGTFAVTTDEKDVDPSRIIQLAVNKQGVIAGTLYNTQTDQAHTVQGQVDKETQRVAFRVGESDKIVVETGLYNLTQNEAPVLVHFGPEKVETYLLVRLQDPEEQSSK